MREATIANRLDQVRLGLFQWRQELSLANKLALALIWAAVTGLAAQVKVPLPFTPIPVSSQTLVVLLAGIVLGRNWGGISQILYIALGMAGIPWFAGAGSGPAALVGPTGGYLIGFVLAAFFLGYVSDKYIASRRFLPMLGLMILAQALIYTPGLLQLGLWLKLVKGTSVSLSTLLSLGCLPFLLGEALKTLAAAAIVKGITPKRPLPNQQ